MSVMYKIKHANDRKTRADGQTTAKHCDETTDQHTTRTSSESHRQRDQVTSRVFKDAVLTSDDR